MSSYNCKHTFFPNVVVLTTHSMCISSLCRRLPRLVLVCCPIMSGSSRKSTRFAYQKRHRRSREPESNEGEGIELTEIVAEQSQELGALHSPINSAVAHAFDMQKPGDKERMASAIWTADFAETMKEVRDANAELVSVLADQTSDTTTVTEVSRARKEHLLDGILLNIVRGQSIHKVPLLTGALSILSEAHLVKREVHDSFSFLMKGALLSEATTANFMKLAALHRPVPKEPMIPGVMAAAFDNLTMNVAYHSMCVAGKTGEQLDMTNWFAVRLPQFLAPLLKGAQACA